MKKWQDFAYKNFIYYCNKYIKKNINIKKYIFRLLKMPVYRY